jgi:hypothetical protein
LNTHKQQLGTSGVQIIMHHTHAPVHKESHRMMHPGVHRYQSCKYPQQAATHPRCTQTIRWAMTDKLRNPPPGLEEVVRAHFRLLRHKVMEAAGGWAAAAAAVGDDVLTRRMQAAVVELRELLAAL